METSLIEAYARIDYLEFVVDKFYDALGPGASDVMDWVNQCYEAEALYFNQTDEVIQKVRHRFVWSWPSFFTHYKILNARLFADLS